MLPFSLNAVPFQQQPIGQSSFSAPPISIPSSAMGQGVAWTTQSCPSGPLMGPVTLFNSSILNIVSVPGIPNPSDVQNRFQNELNVQPTLEAQEGPLLQIQFKDVQKGLVYRSMRKEKEAAAKRFKIRECAEKVVELVDGHLSIFTDRLNPIEKKELSKIITDKYKKICDLLSTSNPAAVARETRNVITSLEQHRIDNLSILAEFVRQGIEGLCRQQYSNRIKFTNALTHVGKRKFTTPIASNKRSKNKAGFLDWSKMTLDEDQKALLYVAIEAEKKKWGKFSVAVDRVVEMVNDHLSLTSEYLGPDEKGDLSSVFEMEYKAVHESLKISEGLGPNPIYWKVGRLVAELSIQPTINFSILAVPVARTILEAQEPLDFSSNDSNASFIPPNSPVFHNTFVDNIPKKEAYRRRYGVRFREDQQALLYWAVSNQTEKGLTISKAVRAVVELVNGDISAFSEPLTGAESENLFEGFAGRYNNWRNNDLKGRTFVGKLISKLSATPTNNLAILAEPVRSNIRVQFQEYRQRLCNISSTGQIPHLPILPASSANNSVNPLALDNSIPNQISFSPFFNESFLPSPLVIDGRIPTPFIIPYNSVPDEIRPNPVSIVVEETHIPIPSPNILGSPSRTSISNEIPLSSMLNESSLLDDLTDTQWEVQNDSKSSKRPPLEASLEDIQSGFLFWAMTELRGTRLGHQTEFRIDEAAKCLVDKVSDALTPGLAVDEKKKLEGIIKTKYKSIVNLKRRNSSKKSPKFNIIERIASEFIGFNATNLSVLAGFVRSGIQELRQDFTEQSPISIPENLINTPSFRENDRINNEIDNIDKMTSVNEMALLSPLSNEMPRLFDEIPLLFNEAPPPVQTDEEAASSNNTIRNEVNADQLKKKNVPYRSDQQALLYWAMKLQVDKGLNYVKSASKVAKLVSKDLAEFTKPLGTDEMKSFSKMLYKRYKGLLSSLKNINPKVKEIKEFISQFTKNTTNDLSVLATPIRLDIRELYQNRLKRGSSIQRLDSL